MVDVADLISPEYVEANAYLHKAHPEFGAGAWRKAAAILEIFTHGNYETLLDYGCGKGALADALPEIKVAEYDPAIPGKDALPEPADMVACLDVLEHIEPEKLHGVLKHLASLTKHEMFFTISTRPAHKDLADGRNAHLIVENAEWWAEQLEQHFQIGLNQVYKDYFWGSASPLGSVGAIRAKMAVGHEERNEQVRLNCAAESRRLLSEGPMPAHDRKAVIVAYGPSLSDTFVDVLKQVDDAGTDIFTVSGAHKYGIDRGLIPFAQIDCDPREHKVKQIGDPHPAVRYWLASCVHPTYVPFVAPGLETKLWHAYNGDQSAAFINDLVRAGLEPIAHMVVGGGSVGLRALSLIYALGYRKIEVHGMDCSFRDGEQHAGAHLGKRKGVIEVSLGDGRKFQTAAALILYFRYFYKQLLWMADAEITLCGDGMLQHAMRMQTNANARDHGPGNAELHPAGSA